MLSNNETNSNVVEIQQLQQNNTTLSSEDLLKHMQSLEKRIKSLEVTNRVILGLFIGTLAAAITVGAGFAIAAAPIIAGSIVGGILATAALAALGVTAYKYRAEIKAGFKYAAEKTVDGAKYTAGKVKDASTYAAGKVRDGAVHVKDKVGEGVDSLKKRFKERDRIVFYNYAKEGDAIEKMTKFPEEDRKKAGEIKHELKAIFADKGDNSKLVKNILSEMLLKIDFKIAEEAKSERIEHTPKWQVQKNFIKRLGEKDLRVLIKQRALPSDVYFIDLVFSEHHDEIKEVIAKCKEDHILKGSLKMHSNMFEEGSAKPSRSLSFSLLGRKNSEQSNSLSRSNSLNSVKTDSTVSSEAELLNPAKHKEVKTTAPFKVPLWLGGKKAPEETTNVKYQVLSESDTLSRQVGKSTFYVDPPKPPRSSSLNSIGTGSTATVSDSDSQSFATVNPNLLRSNSSSSLNVSPKLTPVTLPKPPARGVSLLNLSELNASPQNYFSEDVLNDPIVKQNLDSLSNGTLTRSDSVDSLASSASDCSFKSAVSDHNGSDSGFNSPNSSPTHTVFTNEDGKAKAQAELKKTVHLNKLVGQPSTYTSKACIELQQPAATQGATASK